MSENIPEEELAKFPFRNSKFTIGDRVKDLLDRLTLKDKKEFEYKR